MALRGLVTGSDACTPGDGAGPSNALGSLADSLIGGASKQQERLREVSHANGGVVHALSFIELFH